MGRRDLLNLGDGRRCVQPGGTGLAEGRSFCPRRQEGQRHGTHPGLHPQGRSTADPAGWQCPACGLRGPLQQASSEATRQHPLAQYWQDNCHLVNSVLAEGQAPWAGIITCVDSRVPPSWIFDVNPGQLFVVRSAGNTAFDDGVASVEYAVANLGVSLIMVLGHGGYGAVSAVLGSQPLTPLLEQLVQPIRASFSEGVQDLEQGVESNTRSAAATLTLKGDVLARGVEAGPLKIHGAVYDIASSRLRLV
ncbi:MAG: carbonic anhydrase [Synechococcus sp. SB0676_bin_10]|uniref:carbonic anhydrase n=1 Tax=Synechococcus sp. SB0676_bin_10 TaxID=2604869 RepID=A0A6B1F5U5_9SYNE|nr:carbonic anhydrase [Synechococcus sp. SB0664_bin_36]MYG38331.1 carbonic anhydrase [Synechococcus sp. SB0676_bin_10]MYK06318.1 carbonic anhydrase [Synechococcus sp. SB0670_bin_20]